MNDTIPENGELVGQRNRYAHLVKPTVVFRRLWNRVTNDSCGEEKLRGMIEDALVNSQIKPYEHAKLIQKLAERFGTPETTPKENGPGIGDVTNGDGKTPRSHKDHHNGSPVLVRPRTMVSRQVPNMRDSGPLGVHDFRSGVVETRLVPIDPHLGNAFGSRLRISGPNRR